MDYTQIKGNTNELKCMIAFMLLGYLCSIPYGNSAKYDFIVDIGDKLLRILCKSSNYTINHGVIDYDSMTISTFSLTTNTIMTKRYLYDESMIDYFSTSFNDKVYVIPVNECFSSKVLRFKPPRNGCKKYCLADNYLIENVFCKSSSYIHSKENYKLNNINKENLDNYKCEICGKHVSRKNVLCRECALLLSRKVSWPTREELKDLIWSKSFREIGRIYNVSDKTISKWCTHYNLPNKKRDIKKYNHVLWNDI